MAKLCEKGTIIVVLVEREQNDGRTIDLEPVVIVVLVAPRPALWGVGVGDGGMILFDARCGPKRQIQKKTTVSMWHEESKEKEKLTEEWRCWDYGVAQKGRELINLLTAER